MKLRMSVCGVLCFGVSLICCAEEELRGVVTKVIDGNTIDITATNHETYRVLLHGIDSPDPGQDYSDQARALLQNLLLNETVSISIQGKDRHGNRLGTIQVKGKNDPRQELVKAGLAWTSEKEPIAELELLREQARAEGKGLWQGQNPTPPWIYRRQQSMMQPKSS